MNTRAFPKGKTFTAWPFEVDSCPESARFASSKLLQARLHKYSLQDVDHMHAKGILCCEQFVHDVLEECTKTRDLAAARHAHSLLISQGTHCLTVSNDQFIRFYASCGSLLEATLTFCNSERCTVYTWHAIITAHLTHGENERAIALYHDMIQGDIQPNKFIFSAILKACSTSRVLEQGMLVHDLVSQCGVDSDLVVGSTLVDMYVKCEQLDEAQKIFDMLQSRNAVPWAALIAGYVHYGYDHVALELYIKMQRVGIKPDRVIFLCILKACAGLEDSWHGQLVHIQIIKYGLESDNALGNALVDMYAKCGNLENARKLFDKWSSRDVVSWGALITGYAQNGFGALSVQLYEQMQLEGIKPNAIIVPCILRSCGDIGALEKGKLVHDQIIRCEVNIDIVVGSTLVDMYARCGSLKEALQVFKRLPTHNVVSWGSLIGGYAVYGCGLTALKLFKQMIHEGIEPNTVILMYILKVCGSTGALGQGRLVHGQIIKYNLEGDLIVVSALIVMYSKCGSMKDAWDTLQRSSSQNSILWGSMMDGCAQHGNWSLARKCMEDMQRHGLQPNPIIYSSILSAFAHSGQTQTGQCYQNGICDDFVPTVQHLMHFIDILCASGCLTEAKELLHSMPFAPDLTNWTSLLTACKTYGDVDLGRHCFDGVVRQNPDAVGYVLMSSIYAHAEREADACRLLDQQVYSDAWKKPGIARIELDNIVEEFIVGDRSHQQNFKIYANSRKFSKSLKANGYVPNIGWSL